ncbi:hypothetical protein FRB90_003096 [Tulasnella sp. 427]|nr:hypothetical protein FRB90_003096 [Tulasnella sp. 427]
MSSSVDPLPSNIPQPPAAGPNSVIVDPVKAQVTGQQATDPPYEFWITNTKLNVKSNDRRLNEDPKALQQFLLTHATNRPTVLVACRGTHEEWRPTRDGGDTRVVTDFSFVVDISNALLPAETYGAPVWVVGDEEPANRGRSWRQVESKPPTPAPLEAGSSSGRRRKATALERKQNLDDFQLRETGGAPPWASRSTPDANSKGFRLLLPEDRARFEHATVYYVSNFTDLNLQVPTITLADWTEEYCASRSPLKEFRFQRTVYGWDLNDMERRIKSTLRYCHTGAARKEEVKVYIKGAEVIVRPKTVLWTLLGSGYITALLSLVLIYPLILWPIKQMTSRCWKVAGSSFGFRRWQHLEDSRPGESPAQYVARAPQSGLEAKDLRVSPRGGLSRVVGQTFNQWYEANQLMFSTAASGRVINSVNNPIVVEG